MGFKAGDVVKVVKRVVSAESCDWLPDMDDYICDSKEHKVMNDTDRDGDTFVKMADGQHFYFPAGSLELVKPDVSTVDNLLANIGATYTYKFHNYNTVSDLRRELVAEAYAGFIVGRVQDEDIDALINQLNIVKEACLKLK